MFTVLKWSYSQRKQYAVNSTNVKNTGAAPEDNMGEGSEDRRRIMWWAEDHKSHTSLYLHSSAPRQQFMTTPCEAIMEDTRETEARSEAMVSYHEPSSSCHQTSLLWILTTWFVAGHEVWKTPRPTDDGGGKQLWGKPPWVFLEKQIYNKVFNFRPRTCLRASSCRNFR